MKIFLVRLAAVLVLVAVIAASASGAGPGPSAGCAVYFTNFGASNDSPKDSYIDQYISYLQGLGNGSSGYNNVNAGAGGLVGNWTPTGTPDSGCGSSAPFPTTNITGVLEHSPKVNLISIRTTCDSVKTSGCTVGQIEVDIRLIAAAAAAAGVTYYVQTPQPCECDRPTAITTKVEALDRWVIATYRHKYVDMTKTFSLPDGTVNPFYFAGGISQCEIEMGPGPSAGHTLALQRLKAAIGL